MKTLLTIFALCCSVVVNVFGATPSFLSFDTNDFTVLPSLSAPKTITANRGPVTNIFNNTTIIENHVTNIFTGDVTITTNNITTNYFATTVFQGGTNIFNDGTNIFNNSFTFITNGGTVITITTNITINGTNVATLADLVFTNSAGFIYSLGPHSTISLTNVTSDLTLTARGAFITPSLGSQPLSNGVNVVNPYQQAMIFLYAFETNATVKLTGGNGAGSHLWIFNVLTNIAWTLPSGPLADDTNEVIVVRGGAWTPSEIGESIELVGTPGGWAEINRANPNGPSPALGNNYWTNYAISSVSSLLPIDLGLQPLIQNGFVVGTNSIAFYGGGVITNSSFISFRDVSTGEPDSNEIWIGAINGGASAFFDTFGFSGGFLARVYDSVGGSATLNTVSGNGEITIAVTNVTAVDFTPGAPDGNLPFLLSTPGITHASGNLLELDNNTTKELSVGAFGGTLGVGPNAQAWWGSTFDNGESLIAARVTSLGDPNYNALYITTSQATDGTTALGRFSAESYTNRIVTVSAVITNSQFWDFTVDIDTSREIDPWLFRGRVASGEVLHWSPLIQDAEGTEAFLLQTAHSITNSLFANWFNNGVDVFGVTSGGQLLLPAKHTPGSSSETNYVGAITWDTGFIYVWTATNVNKRATLNTW